MPVYEYLKDFPFIGDETNVLWNYQFFVELENETDNDGVPVSRALNTYDKVTGEISWNPADSGYYQSADKRCEIHARIHPFRVIALSTFKGSGAQYILQYSHKHQCQLAKEVNYHRVIKKTLPHGRVFTSY